MVAKGGILILVLFVLLLFVVAVSPSIIEELGDGQMKGMTVVIRMTGHFENLPPIGFIGFGKFHAKELQE